ncbi:hypothetical protein [Nocardia altamirensis]|uniref:hypothetical protein n=1 Tax=Nocardia altamirensis TaxID=472158 RepID=UPI00084006FC|nr:hypothetical protein [Nocardia altamirensis]
MKLLKVAAAALFTALLMVLAVPGTATAATDVDAVGGRGKIDVSVQSDEKFWIGLVYLDGNGQNFVLSPGGEGSVGPRATIEGVAPGRHHLVVYIAINGNPAYTALDRQIDVAPQAGSGSGN